MKSESVFYLVMYNPGCALSIFSAIFLAAILVLPRNLLFLYLECIFKPVIMFGGIYFSLYLVFSKAKICLFLVQKTLAVFFASILFLLLTVFRLIYGEYSDQSDCRIAHIRWMTIYNFICKYYNHCTYFTISRPFAILVQQVT